mmetsp:Transcript_41278/g.30350  ORF Transcript_41278/g.30350 Transcript_41278/m.30350 type:complete len:103 (+) Transcript_41278:236-544(+)
MKCELCHYLIQSKLQFRPFSLILLDMFKAISKKFKKDKLLIIKLVIYAAYFYISGNKAITCFRLLRRQFTKRYKSFSFAVLSLLYLIFLGIQLLILWTSEIS